MKNRFARLCNVTGIHKFYVSKIKECELPKVYKEVKLTDNYSIVFSTTCNSVLWKERKIHVAHLTDSEIARDRESNHGYISLRKYYMLKIGKIKYAISMGEGTNENILAEEIEKINENKEKEIEKFDNLVNWIFSDSTIEY